LCKPFPILVVILVEEKKLKRKQIVLVGFCLLVITGVFSILSTGTCQQSQGIEKPNAVPAQQAAPSVGADAEVAPAAAPADNKAKAQAVASPDSQKADEKLRRKLEATEGCAAGG
jgi:hypothetical protein